MDLVSLDFQQIEASIKKVGIFGLGLHQHKIYELNIGNSGDLLVYGHGFIERNDLTLGFLG
jgi:hypothetical protein